MEKEYKEVGMNIDRLVLTIAGSFILLGVLLSVFHSPYWLFLKRLGLNPSMRLAD